MSASPTVYRRTSPATLYRRAIRRADRRRGQPELHRQAVRLANALAHAAGIAGPWADHRRYRP